VQLARNAQTVVERKVTLPLRWLKGFVEVQQCQSRMTPVHEISGQEAWRFLRSMPRMKTNRRETFVVASGRGLRLSQVAARDSVRVGGLERLRALEGLSAHAAGLKIYADETTGASAWELSFDDCRFHLVMSPEVWRGFSGEGQALSAIASKEWEPLLPAVKKQLKWQAVVDEEALHRKLAEKSAVSAEQVRGALAALGTQGLVGFDLAEGAWFHRELPFELDAIDKMHPRLRDARKLLAEERVRLGPQTADVAEVLVQSSDVEHRVRISADDARCTCPWYAKHASSRGPCKHILAAQILLEETDHE
jgi:hypothetical protein